MQAARRIPHPLALGGVRMLLILVVLAAIMALTTLAQTGRVATKGYQLVQTQQQLVDLQREADQLRLKIAQAQSLVRVDQRAREALHMVQVMPEQTLYLRVEVPNSSAGSSR